MHFEKKLASERVFSGKIVDVYHDRVELENGRTSLREVISHPGAVAVLALCEGRLLLVRQYRHAVGSELLEIPAGKLEKGEQPTVAAAREMEEETGAVCGELIFLGEYYGSPGILNEAIQVYFTRVKAFVHAHPDADEFVSAVRMDIGEFTELIARGEVSDGKTVFAFTLAEKKGLLRDFSIDNSQSI